MTLTATGVHGEAQKLKVAISCLISMCMVFPVFSDAKRKGTSVVYTGFDLSGGTRCVSRTV